MDINIIIRGENVIVVIKVLVKSVITVTIDIILQINHKEMEIKV